jgi:hypothetical protein
MVLNEFGRLKLNQFGLWDKMQETVKRLSMIPHKRARQRGLVPDDIADWSVEERGGPGPPTKGKCHACDLQRTLTMELVNRRTGARFPIGKDCGTRLDSLFKCCEILNDIKQAKEDTDRVRTLVKDLDSRLS